MVEATLTYYAAGSCRQRERTIDCAGSWKSLTFPAGCATIDHPTRGVVLFDTGYAAPFFEASSRLPYSLYRAVTPVSWSPQQSIRAQLQARNTDPDSIRTVVLTHLHADHCGGLREFPYARVATSRVGVEYYLPRRGLAAVRTAFLPGLMPDDLTARLDPLEDATAVALPSSMQPFSTGHDLFGDGSVLAVALPGHARGQYGFLIGNTFLCADAVWRQSALQREERLPLLAQRITDDVGAYKKTVLGLQQIRRQAVVVIPSHDMPGGVRHG